jgi:hypothetical protein
MSSHINEKVQELKRSMGLSHQEWLIDYKISGENSYVFNDKDKLHELYKDATYNTVYIYSIDTHFLFIHYTVYLYLINTQFLRGIIKKIKIKFFLP